MTRAGARVPHTKDVPPYPVLSVDSGFLFLFLMPLYLFSFPVLAKCFMEVAEEGKRNLCIGNSWRDPDRPGSSATSTCGSIKQERRRQVSSSIYF